MYRNARPLDLARSRPFKHGWQPKFCVKLMLLMRLTHPTACLAGFIIRFADKDSELHRLGCRIAKKVFERYVDGAFLDDMHTVSCYIRLLEYCEEASAKEVLDRSRHKAKLCEQVRHSITQTVSKWENGLYLQAVTVFNSCDSVFYAENKDIAEYECEYMMKSQLDDGSRNIPWSWSDYPAEWGISKNWWDVK